MARKVFWNLAAKNLRQFLVAAFAKLAEGAWSSDNDMPSSLVVALTRQEHRRKAALDVSRGGTWAKPEFEIAEPADCRERQRYAGAGHGGDQLRNYSRHRRIYNDRTRRSRRRRLG